MYRVSDVSVYPVSIILYPTYSSVEPLQLVSMIQCHTCLLHVEYISSRDISRKDMMTSKPVSGVYIQQIH